MTYSFISLLVYAETLVMNCTSKDFKDFAFYKWDSVTNDKPEVFIRSMKGNWVNYCDTMKNNHYKAKCDYGNKKVKRAIEPKYYEKSDYLVTFSELDFVNKKLITTFAKYVNSSSSIEIRENKEKIIYNCREVKI